MMDCHEACSGYNDLDASKLEGPALGQASWINGVFMKRVLDLLFVVPLVAALLYVAYLAWQNAGLVVIPSRSSTPTSVPTSTPTSTVVATASPTLTPTTTPTPSPLPTSTLTEAATASASAIMPTSGPEPLLPTGTPPGTIVAQLTAT